MEGGGALCQQEECGEIKYWVMAGAQQGRGEGWAGQESLNSLLCTPSSNLIMISPLQLSNAWELMGIMGAFNTSKMDWKVITAYIGSDILGDGFLCKSQV